MRQSMVSVFITAIEKKLSKLGISVDNPEYNACFNHSDNLKFERALSVYNQKLDRLIDDLNKGD